MGYGNYDKFSYMLELEFKELYVYKDHHGVTSTENDTHLYTERVYVDYNLDENYLLRAGKYNSNIGFWNLLPVNVLRQTTSNPMTSEIIYPKFSTAIGASYSSFEEGELKIELLAQHNKDLDDEYNNYKIDEHYGIDVLYEENEYSVKFDAGYFHRIEENILEDKLYYLLLSAKYDTEKYQFLSEIGYQKSSTQITTPYAGYIQGLYRFTEQHLGAIRLEAYDNHLMKKKDKIGIMSYTYRPSYPIALKFEYQLHSISEENQILLSLSVLF